MKKIINNKLYDTARAKIIFRFRRKLQGKTCWFNKKYAFFYWTEAQIYVTIKGNYFCHYDAFSNYDEFIEAATLCEVKELVKLLDPDSFIELFGTEEIERA